MRCCGLKVKTEERLVVPWNEGNLITQVQALLPEGQAVAQWDKSITEQLSRERVPTGRERGAPGGRSQRRTPGIWNEASIYKILTNETYTGRAFFGKYRRLSKTTRVRRPPPNGLKSPFPPSSTARPLRRSSVSLSAIARWRHGTGNMSICLAAGASVVGVAAVQ